MSFDVVHTALPDVLVFEPKVFFDERGFFFESFNAREFELLTGLPQTFVQDNHSSSVKGVLRGLHYQIKRPQAKLVRVIKGEIFDVAVDLRRGSPTLGRWAGVNLSDKNRRQLWIPEGFAHAFCVTSESAEVLYKTTEFWFPQYERTLVWNDSRIGIRWPLDARPILSLKDERGKPFDQTELFS